jgi:hypothetical protein
MKLGYFPLRDNLREKNLRSAKGVGADIIDKAVCAETIGRHSARIGEHRLSTPSVRSCPLSGA